MTAAELQACFDLQHRASRAQPDVPLQLRRERLLRLRRLLDEHGPVLAAAVQADFGIRSPRLTEMADFLLLRALLSHTLRHLARWMKPQKLRTPLYLQPASAWVQRQPLGVVGVIAPWNYPVQRALAPTITALAAGNRVLLKPSEHTPHLAAQLTALVAQLFAPDEWCVLPGDAALAARFAALPFDHLVFTGSSAVGRLVAQAAAQNLTPTTLELGGKSPCIIDADCNLQDAALKIAHGKLLNAGQTCIAPDYLLLPRGREGAFAQAYRAAVARLFPAGIEGNPDYAAIITARHHARLQALLQQAQAQGADVQTVAPVPLPKTKPKAQPVLGDGASRQMAPSLVFGATAAMALMQEEIFGPILPVLPYDHLDDALAHVNAGPRPLALYWFGRNPAARAAVLRGTVSGGVTLNDTLLHMAHPGLPFGGVGHSGWGACHGEQGFARLCQQKAVLQQSRWSLAAWCYPPYGARFDRVMALLRRWL
ncbi:aldehyde dehydrogenase family protein [Verminephrobacter eiseniae]|uniref:aldehyde dehydrogenase family protein n=1 Tax=Verminephrobacter eiseniae TaxID=364317 RepID=UPI0022389DCF|nr:aldehyde dehydrogenase family protein [Verminephrobacter eiseniae]MCW5259421.1 aldehyde dehydrogenase family protein [Verminephrobacter eiseniae]